QYEESLVDFSERETANSIAVTNKLMDDSSESEFEEIDTKTITELKEISDDLDSRWQGAVYSLNPKNPDAARHFCTSAREIFIQILDIKAPDNDVMNLLPD